MSWKPIVVGVDLSPEAAGAAVFAVEAAQRAATACYLVHAVHDGLASGHTPYPYTGPDKKARRQIVAALENRVPAAVLPTITVHRGRPAAVLKGAVAARGAELVVLGGKHHSTLGRWLGGSTGLNVARTTAVPLLVTVGEPAIRRVLVAVDQSGAARPTLAAAERYAALFGAELRALSVIEPLPVLPEVPQPDVRSEEHTSELQSRLHLVCRLLLEKKKNYLAEIAHNSLSACLLHHRFITHVRPPPTCFAETRPVTSEKMSDVTIIDQPVTMTRLHD